MCIVKLEGSVTAVSSLEAKSLTTWRYGHKNLKQTSRGLHSNYRAAVGVSVKCSRLWQSQIDSWNKNMLLLTLNGCNSFVEFIWYVKKKLTLLLKYKKTPSLFRVYTHIPTHTHTLAFPVSGDMAVLDWSDCCHIAFFPLCQRCHVEKLNIRPYYI